MTQHPITPPPELVQEWTDAFWNEPGNYVGIDDEALATRAAQWGADQELEACCEWLEEETPEPYINALRAARRPSLKPPSLKEQALEQLDGIAAVFRMSHGGDLVCDTIRRAIEALPE
jgi:hypothetical protein